MSNINCCGADCQVEVGGYGSVECTAEGGYIEYYYGRSCRRVGEEEVEGVPLCFEYGFYCHYILLATSYSSMLISMVVLARLFVGRKREKGKEASTRKSSFRAEGKKRKEIHEERFSSVRKMPNSNTIQKNLKQVLKNREME
jgi:hypothetical protein